MAVRWWFLLFVALVAGSGRSDAACTGGSCVFYNAFYVALTGNDSNPGTLAAPFLTLGRAQTAMRASSTIKTTYIRAGTYFPVGNSSGTPYYCYHTLSNISVGNPAIVFAAADSGETWAVYPPDGVGSAIIDGGSSSSSTGLASAFCGGVNSLSNITINGLVFQHFAASALWLGQYPPLTPAPTNITFTNNIVHDIYSSVVCCDNIGGGVYSWGGATNLTISHNAIYNTAFAGIAVFSYGGGSPPVGQLISNLTISNNYVNNTCNGFVGVSADCGGIYLQDPSVIHNVGVPLSTNIKISNNYVHDTGIGSTTGGIPIYLDDGMSNVTQTGNVSTGYMSICFNIHGGLNNHMTGEICDTTTSPNPSVLNYQSSTAVGPFASTTAPGSGSTLTFSAVPPFTTNYFLIDATNPGAISSTCTVASETTTQITTTCSVAAVPSGDIIYFRSPMTGNIVSGNIIIDRVSSVSSFGYVGNSSTVPAGTHYPPTSQVTVGGDYFAYGGGNIPVNSTGTNNAASDSNPQNVDPQLNCWSYKITAGSPVFSAPISFPAQGANWGIPGFWGPPDFVVFQTGTPPSQPHGC